MSLQLTSVLDDIAACTAAAGRAAGSVKLVAVSKRLPLASIAAAYAAGQRRFGENQVQELVAKAGSLPDDIEWHLIGHLQGNKVREAVAVADVIQSVDSQKLLRRIDRLAGEIGKRQAVLLQINVADEPQKSGFAVAEAEAAAILAAELPAIDCLGLMAMAPLTDDESVVHGVFAGLRELAVRLRQATGSPLPELSMGMSGDFRAAIAEGATLVRLGTAVFGSRPQ